MEHSALTVGEIQPVTLLGLIWLTFKTLHCAVLSAASMSTWLLHLDYVLIWACRISSIHFASIMTPCHVSAWPIRTGKSSKKTILHELHKWIVFYWVVFSCPTVSIPLNCSLSVFRHALISTTEDGGEGRERCNFFSWTQSCCCMCYSLLEWGQWPRHWPLGTLEFFSKWWSKWSLSWVAIMRDLPKSPFRWGLSLSCSEGKAKQGLWVWAHAGLRT